VYTGQYSCKFKKEYTKKSIKVHEGKQLELPGPKPLPLESSQRRSPDVTLCYYKGGFAHDIIQIEVDCKNT